MTPADQLVTDEPEGQEPDSQEIYWAQKQGKQLASALKEKETAFFTALERRGFRRMWRIQYAQYYGQDPDAMGDFATQMIRAAGEDGELLDFRLQECRSLLTRQIQMAVGDRPAFVCKATNNDHATIGQINICDSAVEYVYDEAHAEQQEADVVESDVNFGSGFGWARWDETGGDDVTITTQMPIDPKNPAMGTVPTQSVRKSGMPTVTVVYPWECVQETTATTHMWRLIRERRSKWELAAKFPEQRERILAIKELDEYTTDRLFGLNDDHEDNDDVLVKHFYHERGGVIAEGRYVGIVGDLILWDEACPVAKGLPIKEMRSEKFIGTSFGYASGWDLNAPNMMIDQICSDTASNLATFGRQVIAVYEGTDFDLDALANGHRAIMVPQGSELPQALNFVAMPEPAKWMLEYLNRRMEGISGINSVSRGDPQANISSGSMAALFHEIAVEFQQRRQAAFDKYREGMANLLLDLVRTNAPDEFFIDVAGEDERPYLTLVKTDTLSGVKRVKIKTANPMMRTVAGRMEIFTALKGIENPRDREAALKLLLTGDTKDFTRSDMTENLAIKWENEQLVKGVPVPVIMFDDHAEHYEAHRAELNARREWMLHGSENDNGQDESIGSLQMLLQHIQAHHQAYYDMPPVFAEWNGMTPPPAYRGQPGGPTPQPANLAPEGAMGGGGAAAAKSATNVAGGKPQNPADASGTEQPQAAEPAQAPGGPAQNVGEAA